MTLEEMCIMAARYSDRYDEFERTLEGGASVRAEDWYEEDALHYFNVFRDGINEAYREVSRLQAMPDTYAVASVNRKQQIDLTNLDPAVYTVKDILNYDGTASVDYTFDTKYVLNVKAAAGDKVRLFYHYIPENLELLVDEPIFSEAQVDSMVYVSLAVARMWYSEKKFDFGNQWMSQYYSFLRNVKSNLKDRSRRRIPRGIFR
jgi:hypothetical protein